MVLAFVSSSVSTTPSYSPISVWSASRRSGRSERSPQSSASESEKTSTGLMSSGSPCQSFGFLASRSACARSLRVPPMTPTAAASKRVSSFFMAIAYCRLPARLSPKQSSIICLSPSDIVRRCARPIRRSRAPKGRPAAPARYRRPSRRLRRSRCVPSSAARE